MTSYSRLPAWFTIPFFCTLLCWAYLPFSHTPFITLWDIPFCSTDGCLFLLLFISGSVAIAAPRKNERLRARCGSLATWLFVTFAYAVITMFWSDLDSRNVLAMGYTLLCGAACFLVPYAAYSVMTDSQVRNFLWFLSVVLALISFSYFVQSFFGLHLKARTDYDLITFGMERVSGPLLYPATLHFQILPAAAFIIGEVLGRRVRFTVAAPLLGMIFVTLLGSGSRSALICLTLFLLFLSISLRGRVKLIAVSLVLIVCVTTGTVLATKAKADRLLVSDPMREWTYATSLNIVSNQTMMHRIFGDGYGHWWPWYVVDVEGGGAQVTGRVIQSTNYGPTLYHPHSLFLISWVELGIIGLIPFVALMVFLLQMGFGARSEPRIAPLLCSLAALVPAFGIDTFLVKSVRQNLVWWCFVLGACLLRSYSPKVRREMQMVLQRHPARGLTSSFSSRRARQAKAQERARPIYS